MTAESVSERYGRWGLSGLLWRYSGLTVKPTLGTDLVLSGDLEFLAERKEHGLVEDRFTVEIQVAVDFPQSTPKVFETAGRIPKSFHRHKGGHLCLGSPLRLRLTLKRWPDLIGFVDRCVVPYLFSVSVWERTGRMPYGELAHGDRGLLDEYRGILRVESDDACMAALRILAMKRRCANKMPCPCGSGRRLGRCHHKTFNRIRKSAGRVWLKSYVASLLGDT